MDTVLGCPSPDVIRLSDLGPPCPNHVAAEDSGQARLPSATLPRRHYAARGRTSDEPSHFDRDLPDPSGPTHHPLVAVFLACQLPAFRVPTWQVADVEPGLGALDWGHSPPTLSSVASASPIVTKILASGIGNRMLGSVMWSECAEAPPL